ncbi:MAG: hypothetical protein AAF502_10215 [Bacteroidota bacterium]
MIKYTNYNLKKFEALFKEQEFTILYERGNFQAGYCIVENRNVIVINKYFDTEARINCLVEILGKIKLNQSLISDASAQFLKKIQSLLPVADEATLFDNTENQDSSKS